MWQPCHRRLATLDGFLPTFLEQLLVTLGFTRMEETNKMHCNASKNHRTSTNIDKNIFFGPFSQDRFVAKKGAIPLCRCESMDQTGDGQKSRRNEYHLVDPLFHAKVAFRMYRDQFHGDGRHPARS